MEQRPVAAAGRPVLAGLLTAVVGFTSSFAVVLAGLRGVGATQAEAASGLVAVCATQALGILWLSRRHRMPITLAWSTPGAAVLATIGAGHSGWPSAVGAFLLVGALIVLTGLWERLGALVAAIPAPVAQAMLAGVVLELCLVPARGAATHPGPSAPSCSPGCSCCATRRDGPFRPRSQRLSSSSRWTCYATEA